METYKNSYTKKEDPLLWELHEIRHLLSEKHQGASAINQSALDIIKRYNLKHLKVIKSSPI